MRRLSSQPLDPWTLSILDRKPDTGPYLTEIKTLELILAKWEPSTQDI